MRINWGVYAYRLGGVWLTASFNYYKIAPSDSD